MLNIILGPERPAPTTDELHRSHVGYRATMTPQEAYEANHGCWHLGSAADEERYVTFSYQGIVVLVIAIESIETESTGRRTLNGPILGPAHPVYDHFAGQPAPTKGRNPVGYFKSEFDLRPCLCRCGGISYNNFLPGHDQRAIHERIGKIGTVKDFLTWFDEHWTSK